ncbi:MAG TPA: DUF6351 family protein [Mycobacteriales bacterium]|nr:DUF6351 family protein [Mycobacteriales bacterium]
MNASVPVRRRAVLLSAVMAALIALGGGLVVVRAGATPGRGVVKIAVLSNRADLISGGDALVRVRLPAGANADRIIVTVNGHRESSLEPDHAQSLSGLLTGLRNGPNVVRAVLPDGRGAELTITNHPSGGPVFAGPQVHPWVCDNASGGNGAPKDAQCDTAPTYEYEYRAAPGEFETYDPANPPALVPTTTTDQGKTVPYIVRIEHGTMDRGNYLIGVLWDMKANRPTAWNHKLLVPFGASTAVHYGSGAPTAVTDDTALGRGYLVADNSLDVQGQNANGVVSAEAVMMLKERIIERYGSIRFTIGNGCSGGAIQQNLLVSMYPGLLDGIQPNCSFSDMFTTGLDVLDCHLLLNYFDNTSPSMWANETQRAAVDGNRDSTDCEAWDALFAGAFDPTKASNCNLPQAEVYDPKSNPKGVRCTIPDYMVSVLGRRPKSFWGAVEKELGHGFGQLPLDTVGVQYGLKALQAGTISPAQFADLNAKIGAITIDDVYTPQRLAAVPAGVASTYRSGLIADPRQWANVPIIDLRGYSESSEIHTSVYTYASRARLDDAVGNHDNQIVWTFDPAVPIAPTPTSAMAAKAFDLMDRWLTAVEADHRHVPKAQKVRQDKPADAKDECFAGDQQLPASSCATVYPYYSTPRIQAGESLRNDNIKCQLKALRRSDYKVAFTAAEWTELERAFPTGVCDWSKPAVGQQPAVTWLTYATGPGGTPLGAAPASIPFRLPMRRGTAATTSALPPSLQPDRRSLTSLRTSQ